MDKLREQSRVLSSATIVLGKDATKRTKFHEAGHVEQAILAPVQFMEQAAEAKSLPRDAYNASKSEVYAESFAEDVEKDDPVPE